MIKLADVNREGLVKFLQRIGNFSKANGLCLCRFESCRKIAREWTINFIFILIYIGIKFQSKFYWKIHYNAWVFIPHLFQLLNHKLSSEEIK